VISGELVGEGAGEVVGELARAAAEVDTGCGATSGVVRTGVGVTRACDREAVVGLARAAAVVGAVVVVTLGAVVDGTGSAAAAGEGAAALAGSA
jgi:hypothetical protein